MKVQEKYFDEVFDFAGQWDMPSKCGLKVVEPAGGPTTVIVTELYQDNPGTSVTYAGRALAEQICKAKGLDIGAIRYVECRPDTGSKLSFYGEELFEVTFNPKPMPNSYRRLPDEEAGDLLK